VPPLLRGMARTAVVAGTATAVSGRVARRQNQRWAAEEQAAQPQGYPQEAYAQPEAAPAADDRDRQIAQLKELADLKAQGILTEEEFAAQKAQILGS
jgi:Short C-terminal domain